MATNFVPTNDSTLYVVRINSVDYTTAPTQEFPASAISVVTPDKISVNGTTINVLNCRVYDETYAQGVKSYYFSNSGNNATIAGFLTMLTNNTVTNNLTTYAACTTIGGAVQSAPISVLVNVNRVVKQRYIGANDTTQVTINMGKFTQKVFIFNGDLDVGAAKATATLAVPIAASPVNGSTATFTLDGTVLGTYTVSGSPSQATVKTGIEAILNGNGGGYTFAGTLASNTDTIVGTAPAAGTTYNGKVVSVAVTGTTFGTNPISATFAGGV